MENVLCRSNVDLIESQGIWYTSLHDGFYPLRLEGKNRHARPDDVARISPTPAERLSARPDSDYTKGASV